MKIYLFNPETGVFLGEDFADESLKKGAYLLPPDATPIAPPKVEFGHVAVFNATTRRWEAHSLRCNGSPMSNKVCAGEGEDHEQL